VCTLLAREFRMSRDLAMFVNKNNPTVKHPSSRQKEYPFEDEMVSNCFSWYSPLCFESLSDTLVKDIVEDALKTKVYPTYSYARIYYQGSQMFRHVDRSSSEFSVSLCIDNDKNYDWPLELENKEKQVVKVYQEPGDLIIYRGNNLFHWRSKFLGNEHISAFMFYVNSDDYKKELKYDTRPLLGLGVEHRKMTSEEQWDKYPTIHKN
jgi:hypothetical protein